MELGILTDQKHISRTTDAPRIESISHSQSGSGRKTTLSENPTGFPIKIIKKNKQN